MAKQEDRSEIDEAALALDATWTRDELLALIDFVGTKPHAALNKALTRLRDHSRAALLSPETDFPMTQFHRGRLRVLADLKALLETEAKEKYDELTALDDKTRDAKKRRKENRT